MIKKSNLIKKTFVIALVSLFIFSLFSCNKIRKSEPIEKLKNKNYDAQIYYSELKRIDVYSRVNNEYMLFNSPYKEYYVINGDTVNYSKYYNDNLLEQKLLNVEEKFPDIVDMILANDLLNLHNYIYQIDQIDYFLKKEVFKKVENALKIQNLNSMIIKEKGQDLEIDIIYKISNIKVETINIKLSNIGNTKIILPNIENQYS